MLDRDSTEHENNQIPLEKNPTGDAEFRNFSNPDIRQKHVDIDGQIQDMHERKAFALKAYSLTQAWIGFLIVITLAQMTLASINLRGLTEKEFITVFTTSTVSVFGFWTLVGKYLFHRNSEKKPAKRK